MKSVKDKKKDYQKETVFFMWAWIFIFGLGLVLDLMDAAFGEPLNVMSTIVSVVYLVFFGFGLHFAKQGKSIAGVLELVAGVIILGNDLLPDKAIGLNGILGVLVILHAVMYLYHHRKK